MQEPELMHSPAPDSGLNTPRMFSDFKKQKTGNIIEQKFQRYQIRIVKICERLTDLMDLLI